MPPSFGTSQRRDFDELYPLDLSGPSARLQPMRIDGVIAHGNDFGMNGPAAAAAPMRIHLRIRLPGDRHAIVTGFTHPHDRRPITRRRLP